MLTNKMFCIWLICICAVKYIWEMLGWDCQLLSGSLKENILAQNLQNQYRNWREKGGKRCNSEWRLWRGFISMVNHVMLQHKDPAGSCGCAHTQLSLPLLSVTSLQCTAAHTLLPSGSQRSTAIPDMERGLLSHTSTIAPWIYREIYD